MPRFGARATLRAAERSREEARLARFADRIREVGAVVLDSAYRFTEAVAADAPTANLGIDCPRQIRELRLVVRHEATGLLLDELLGCLYVLDSARPGGDDPTPILLGPGIRRSRELQQQIEDALRAELELPPAPREVIDF